MGVADCAWGWLVVGSGTHHVHRVAEQQPLGPDAGDVVHEEMLPGEEVLQAAAQPSARPHAALVELVQMPHHYTHMHKHTCTNKHTCTHTHTHTHNYTFFRFTQAIRFWV